VMGSAARAAARNVPHRLIATRRTQVGAPSHPRTVKPPSPIVAPFR
jgi:hypothetical protein